MMVLASSFALDEFACTVIAAELVAFVAPSAYRVSLEVVREILFARVLVAAATVAAYRGVMVAFDHSETVAPVLLRWRPRRCAQFVAEIDARGRIMKRGSSLTTRAAWRGWRSRRPAC